MGYAIDTKNKETIGRLERQHLRIATQNLSWRTASRSEKLYTFFDSVAQLLNAHIQVKNIAKWLLFLRTTERKLMVDRCQYSTGRMESARARLQTIQND